jgi:NTP-dependent ternary system trypsin peptidase co-occuring protein
MGDVKLKFEDGSVVRLHLAPGSVEASPVEPSEGRADDAAGNLELPEGFGNAQPVSVDGRVTQALSRGGAVLTEALRPLGGVLGGIHQSFTQFAQRPDEVTVEFGVTLGSDLSLGVFSGSGEASFTVSATWNLGDPSNPPEADPSTNGAVAPAVS